MGWSFGEGETAAVLARLDAIRQILTSGGRTLAQGALSWIWARSGSTIPIPGYTTVEQVEENIGADDVELTGQDLREIQDAAARVDIQGGRYSEQMERMTNL